MTCVCMRHRGLSPPHNDVGTLSDCSLVYGMEGSWRYGHTWRQLSISVHYYMTCVCMSHRGQSPPYNDVGTLAACPLVCSVEGSEGMVTHRDNSLSVSITTWLMYV